LPEVEPAPGPGHYNLVDYEGEGKRYMSSSMFVSTTNRWNPAWEAETEVPGPSMFSFVSIIVRECSLFIPGVGTEEKLIEKRKKQPPTLSINHCFPYPTIA
jgi:hypothetical protein